MENWLIEGFELHLRFMHNGRMSSIIMFLVYSLWENWIYDCIRVNYLFSIMF